jgi:iron complex outermembrane recepter protein
MFQKKTLSLSIAMIAALGSSYVAAAPQDDQIEEIVVTGIRGSLSKALDIKRENAQVVDAIVAEDIGKFPDNNVIEAMQHITGVQVAVDVKGEGQAPVIRGSADIVTTLNGQQVFTGSGRNMSLQDIPATLVAGIEVYKSTSADMIEGGVGGLVNVKLRRPFDFDGAKFAVSAKGTYNDQSEKTDPNLSALASNRWDTSAGEFGALVNVAYSENNYREEAVWGGGFFPYSSTGQRDDAAFGYEPGKQLSTSPDSPYVLMRDAAGSWDRYGVTKRPAVNVSLQWSPADNLETYLDAAYQGYEGRGNMSFLFTRTDAQQKPGTNYTYHEGTNVVKTAQTINAFLLTSSQAFEGSTDSMQYSTGADWDVSDAVNIKADINYQTSKFDNTSQILDLTRNAPTLDVNFNQGGAVSLDYGNYDLNSTEGVVLGTYFDGWTHSTGSALAAKVDVDYTVELGAIDKLEFGVRYSSRDAYNDDVQRSICDLCWEKSATQSALDGMLDVTPGSFVDGTVTFPRQWLTPSIDWLLNSDNQNTMRQISGLGYTGRPAFDPTRHFDITEDTTAVYGQFHYAFELAGKEVDGLVGARLVSTSSELNSFEVSGDTGAASPITLNSDDSEVLPNASFRIQLSEDLVGRLNASKTLTRPAFADLNPAMTIRDPIEGQINQGTGSGGNPNLVPYVSSNLDAALEWYFAEDSSLTATVFKRNFDDTVLFKSRTIMRNSIPYVLSAPENAGKSDYTGYEIGFQYFPENVPTYIQGLGLQSSYTYIDGTLTDKVTGQDTILPNVSKNSYSFAVSYEKEKYSARVSYVYRDGYKSGENTCCSMPIDIMAQDYGSTDVSMSYDITDDIVITLDATNIFGDNFHDYFGDATLFNRDTVRFAKTVSAGIRASF